jgi:hypothetical protein
MYPLLEFLNILWGLASRNRVVVTARQATQPDGIGSLESILGLLESFKIRAQNQSQIISPIFIFKGEVPACYRDPQWLN